MEVSDGDDVVGGDAEAFELAGDEPTEGVVPDSGDDAGAVPELGDGDGDVGGAAAEELSEVLTSSRCSPTWSGKMSTPERPIVRMST